MAKLSTTTQIDRDAGEFGRHFRQGGWRLGLLVARSVKPGKAGRPAKNTSPEMDSDGKISQTEFASKAGVAQSHIKYYFDAWELAADAGYCQHSKDLAPGDSDLDDFDEDDFERRELWIKFYRKAKEPKNTQTKSESKSGSKESKPKAQTQSKAKVSSTEDDSEESFESDFEHIPDYELIESEDDEEIEDEEIDLDATEDEVIEADSAITHAAVLECLETARVLESQLNDLAQYGDLENESELLTTISNLALDMSGKANSLKAIGENV